MKIHILFKIKDGAWGGGNQFLKILRQKFIEKSVYEEDEKQADTLLVNSYQDLLRALLIKYKYPKKKSFYRLGPVFFLHRKKYWKLIDKIVIRCAQYLADGVIFQSEWSLKQAVYLGFKKDVKSYAIIGNAVDENCFYPRFYSKELMKPVRLVAVSWSKNWNKGFKFLKYLDEHLDFNHYTLTFIGNTPLAFKNINYIPPLDPLSLGEELRKHDIYLSGVKDDACSNSLLEALACGLPVVAFDSGANREIVKEGGVLFDAASDLIDKIDELSNNYVQFKLKIDLKSSEEIVRDYLNIFNSAPFTCVAISFWKFIFFYMYISCVVKIVSTLDRILVKI